jgi:hypothetical protein
MAKLKLTYDTRDELPAGYEELYTEKDGKFHFDGVEGMKTDADILRINNSLKAEREAHKDTKAKLTKFKDLDPEDVVVKLDKYDEMEVELSSLKSGRKPTGDEVEKLVETRLKRILSPIERERDEARSALQAVTGERDNLKGTLTKRDLNDVVRRHATDLKVIAPAIDDVLLHAGHMFKEDEHAPGTFVSEDGLTPDVWLRNMQEKRPHWWATSVGGGGNGGGGGRGGPNPWSAKDWNMTEQGKYLQEHGREKAAQMAKQAGTVLGGMPAKAS